MTTIEHVWNHIQQNQESDTVHGLPFYCAHNPELTAKDVQSITDLLHMAWATEYALRADLEMGDDFLRYSFHWTLPQAAHCLNHSLRAFMFTTGVRSANRQLLEREAGRMVVRNVYPRALSFYAAGGYGDFAVHRLPLQSFVVTSAQASPEIATQHALTSALKANRKAFAQKTRLAVQDNPNTAIRRPTDGKPLTNWKAEHWQQITWRLGYTAWPSLINELRMEQNSPELAAYAKGITDYRAFHEALVGVVETISGVHENYCIKAIGEEAYTNIITGLPKHLHNSFPGYRFSQHLKAISQSVA